MHRRRPQALIAHDRPTWSALVRWNVASACVVVGVAEVVVGVAFVGVAASVVAAPV